MSKALEQLQASVRNYMHELGRIGPLHRRPEGCSEADQAAWFADVEEARAHLHRTIEDLEVLCAVMALGAQPPARPASAAGSEGE